MPIIQNVCKKVGIDRSTFYRWMAKHHTFGQEVVGALVVGRERINDAAEGVIISGIQNNDRRAAIYWLSHNSTRYTAMERVEFMNYLNRRDYLYLGSKKPPNEGQRVFDVLFVAYSQYEEVFGAEEAKTIIDPLVKIVSNSDTDLENIFYVAYREWKNKVDAGREKLARVKNKNP